MCNANWGVPLGVERHSGVVYRRTPRRARLKGVQLRVESDHPARSLEPSAEEMRHLLEKVSERVVRHVSSLHEQPANGAIADPGHREPGVAIDGGPLALEETLDLLFDRLAPRSFTTAGPGFMAYVPGGGLFHTAIADLIADTLNRYTTVWAAAPGLADVEASVIRWLCEMVGYPASSGGFLSSGGSIANLTALVAARRDRLPEVFQRGTIYVSSQTHHSIEKAALIAGFPRANVRRVDVDAEYRIMPDKLAKLVASDRAQGLEPFLVVGNGGTTNTGAVDPLHSLAEIATDHSLWFHIDAAYGGFFMLTERGKHALQGIERADSITLDPHKGMFLPYGTGCLIVRHLEKLRAALSVAADYMPPLQESEGRLDLSEVSPELSRGFRGLRVWLPLKLVGETAFREALDEKLDLIVAAEKRLRSIEGIEIVAPPQLSTLAFRLVRPGLSEAELDSLNERLLHAINRRQRAFLTSTRLRGAFVIRICVLSFRTHLERIEMCTDDVRSAVEELCTESLG